MIKKGKKEGFGLSLRLFSLMFIILTIPLISAICPEDNNNESCDNVIEDYIIDEDIDIRTLIKDVSEPAHLSENKKTCSKVGQQNTSDEYGTCMEIYSSLYMDENGEDYCIDDPHRKNWIEGSQSDFNLLISSSEKNLATSGFCWSCESGTYETDDSESSCECDEDEKCFDYFTKSTAIAGGSSACWSSCNYESKADYCSDLNNLVEYYVDCYCCDEVFSVTFNCNDYNSYSNEYSYCSGDEVWEHRWYWDYDCGNGACFYDSAGSGWTDDQYIEDCDNNNYYGSYENYCSGDEVWKHRLYYDYDCDNGDCVFGSSIWTNNQYVKTCDSGCISGKCAASIRVYPNSLNFEI